MRHVRGFLRSFSLRTQLIMTFLFLMLLAVGLLALFFIRMTREALLDQANQALYAAASRTAVSLDTFIRINKSNIETQAAMPTVVSYISLPPEERANSPEEAVMFQTLDILRNKDFFYIASYAILDKNGTILLDTATSDIGKNEADKLYFQEPLRTGRPYMSAVEFADQVGGVYFYLSSPVRNNLGQVQGVLRARYSIALLQELVKESRGLAGDSSWPVLLDEYYLRLSQEQAEELLFKTVAPLEPEEWAALGAQNRLPNLPPGELSTDMVSFAQALANLNPDEPYILADEVVGDGRLEQMAVVPLTSQPWLVVYMQPQDVFLAPVESAIQLTLLWTVFFVTVFLLVAVFFSRLLTDPLTHLTRVATRITAGDLSAQAVVESKDEIGRLAYSFNMMTAQLRQTLEGLERREEALQASNTQLETTLQQLQEAQAQMVQQERIAAVGQMAAGIAHDFNNIMATIVLYSDLLLRTPTLDAKDRERIRLIQQQGQRAADLTQQILDFSRKSIMQRKEVDLWPLLLEMEALLQRTMPENIRLQVIRTGALSWARVDATRIQQVVLNLVINAQNAMSKGGELRIALGNVAAPVTDGDLLLEAGPWLTLAISDSGTGIPDEVLAHMFEPFFTTRAPLGSGLGLSQVDGIVKQHGGHIAVQTAVGEGTTFIIYLPALPVSVLPTAVSPTDVIVPGNRETLLVVEDDPLTRMALENSLESLNYRVYLAENGRHALQLYQQHSSEIVLVLTDLVMPELGGKELLEQLRQLNPTLGAVIITGYPLSNQEEEFRSLEMLEWCQKPISLDRLSQVVARALHGNILNKVS